MAESGSPIARREALFLLARTTYESGDIAGAAANLDAYLVQYPTSLDAPRAYLLRAEARAALGLPEPAVADLSAYLDIGGPATSYALMRRGDLHRALGDTAAAIADYSAALGGGLSGYEESDVLLTLIDLSEALGDFEAALEWAQRAFVVTPSTTDRATALGSIASLSRSLGDQDGWMAASLRLVREFPRHAVAFGALEGLRTAGVAVNPLDEVRLYLAQQNPAAADSILLDIVTTGSAEQRAEAAYHLGVMREAANDPEAALAWYEQASPLPSALAVDREMRRLRLALDLGHEGAAGELEAFVAAHPGTRFAMSGAAALASHYENTGTAQLAADRSDRRLARCGRRRGLRECGGVVSAGCPTLRPGWRRRGRGRCPGLGNGSRPGRIRVAARRG